ncbi:MAG: helix-turn-helix domain-containing protein [Kiritimatiellae bacterium]|nr:helix-turn-helix domain-containing protein [Kiritimatiellia bacterium]
MLATTALSQEQIALACGFYDASHLGAAFRRHVGRPPSAFRVKREA